jgi:hypothetical protein
MNSSLFQQLAQVRAVVRQVIVDTEQIHDAIMVPESAGGERGEALDLRTQLREAVRELYSARAYLKPLEEHVDQPFVSRTVTEFRRPNR